MTFQKNSKVKELYISRQNLMEYLKRQNYNVSDIEEFTINEINAMYNVTIDNVDVESPLNFNIEHIENPDKKCNILYYLNSSSIKQSKLQEIITNFYSEDINKENNTLIIVVLNPINDSTQKTLKQCWKQRKEYVVMFDINSLMINILEHSFVPEHVKLNNEEKQLIYEKYNITHDNEVPEISMFDPVAKVMLMRPGELCEITRFDKISLQNKFYRICVI